jgi:1,4-alpha-glucan branching enzyme
VTDGGELGDLDLYLIGEGRHHRLWDALGAHPYGDPQSAVSGTRFAVWAPNALEVRLVGDFNGWDRTTLPMSLRAGSGIWQLDVPGAHVSLDRPR